MKYRSILLLLSTFLPVLVGCAGPPAYKGELFAAMIMTKQQQASSVPTESGLMVHDPEDGTWHRLGPEIQMISSATTDPTDARTVFLACGNGIVRTIDGGRTWRLVTGWRESDVLQIAIDPENPDNIYAATAWGVTVSRDGGDSWTASNAGLPEYYAKGIVLDKRDPQRILLATTTGLFESRDGAGTWRRVATFPEVAVLRLRRGESNPDLWLAGTEGEGVWLSRDDGRSWQMAAPALAGENIYAVAVDPVNASRLAAGGWGTGVHLSEDGGRTWTRAPGPLPSDNVTVMVFDQHTDGRLWVSTFEEGTYFTDNAGAAWQDGNLYGAYVFDLGFLE